MSSSEVKSGEAHVDEDLVKQREALAANRIAAILELLDGVPPDKPIDHVALDRKVREIGETVTKANSRF